MRATEEHRPLSLDCAIARTPEQHARCRNEVRPFNLSDRPLVPCGCDHHDSRQTDSEQLTSRSTVRP